VNRTTAVTKAFSSKVYFARHVVQGNILNGDMHGSGFVVRFFRLGAADDVLKQLINDVFFGEGRVIETDNVANSIVDRKPL
jgi:hypothetical protein